MTYRTGDHHGVTIVREGDGARCGRPDHDCARGHLVAVVVDGFDGRTAEEEAERICKALNFVDRAARCRWSYDCEGTPDCGGCPPKAAR